MSREPAHPDLEVIASLSLPLPLDLSVAVMDAIAKAAERLGYTNPVILTDGIHRFAATRPAPDWEPDDDDEDAVYAQGVERGIAETLAAIGERDLINAHSLEELRARARQRAGGDRG